MPVPESIEGAYTNIYKRFLVFLLSTFFIFSIYYYFSSLLFGFHLFNLVVVVVVVTSVSFPLTGVFISVYSFWIYFGRSVSDWEMETTIGQMFGMWCVSIRS